jgi:hypothetical protein
MSVILPVSPDPNLSIEEYINSPNKQISNEENMKLLLNFMNDDTPKTDEELELYTDYIYDGFLFEAVRKVQQVYKIKPLCGFKLSDMYMVNPRNALTFEGYKEKLFLEFYARLDLNKRLKLIDDDQDPCISKIFRKIEKKYGLLLPKYI